MGPAAAEALAVALDKADWQLTDSQGLSTPNKDTASHEDRDCVIRGRKALQEGRNNRDKASNAHCPATTQVISLAQVSQCL